MKPIEEVFPEAVDRDWYETGDYQALVDSFGFQELLASHDSGYQGDSRYLLSDKGKIGYLNFGWGSCSGCDALQACSDLKQIEELRLSLFNDIKWFESFSEALTWFTQKDWSTDYHFLDEEQKKFVSQAIEILKKGI